jgi:ATP-binding protein involved in chromosome partitioning
MMFAKKNSQSPPTTNGLTPEAVIEVLRPVNDPELHKSLVDLGMIKDVKICGSTVAFEVVLTTPACPLKATIQKDCTDAVKQLEGVEEVNISWSSQVPKGRSNEQRPLLGVNHVIAVASGKGGVGKSTISVNLAAALAATGARVGLLDCDIYGPSIPMMLDIHEQPFVTDVTNMETADIERKMLPLEKFDMKLMSIGFLVPDDKAAMWRGPMVASGVRQMLFETHWGDLDYLIVDLPPGTGDAPMSLAQLVPLTGVVIVMTPQELALTIAAKSIRLFEQLNAPILGIVENMAMFVCPNCAHETDIFGHTGAGELTAEKFGVRFLGRVPLDPRVTDDSDTGIPTIISAPDSKPSIAYKSIAGQVAAEASVKSLTQPKPKSQPIELVSLDQAKR